ncbi:MAG: hypothetical protein AB1635_14405 [Acidobacteriota bacterium]
MAIPGQPVSPVSPLDREQIALVEVGQTTVTPAVARALVAWFLAMLALLPLVEWWGGRGDPAGPGAWSRLAALPGEMSARVEALGADPDAWAVTVAANRAALAAFAAFERALEDDSPVGRLLRPWTQAALSGWLGAGNERVYVGRDRWLYYRPDVELVTGPGFLDARRMARRRADAAEFETPPAPDPRPAILRFQRDLAARGIALVLVPTPVKPTVHPERLAGSGDVTAPVQNVSFAALMADLAREGVLVFDPAPMLAEAARAGTPQYLATDTHWRPEAMTRVAAALAAFLRNRVPLADAPAARYASQPREARHTGDIVAMMDLPPGQTLFPPERVELRFVVDAEGDPFRPVRGADVLVLGDSFSNIYALPTMGWGASAGFVEQLAFELQRPVDRLVQNDQAAFATRAALARDLALDADRLRATRVVVWQFATRELAFGDWRVVPLEAAASPR